MANLSVTPLVNTSVRTTYSLSPLINTDPRAAHVNPVIVNSITFGGGPPAYGQLWPRGNQVRKLG